MYAALMTLFVAAGVLLAYVVANRGSAESARLAAIAVGIAGLAGFLPSLIRLSGGMQTWGLLIFGASMVRMLGLLVVAFYFTQVQEIVKQPYWLGIAGGGVVILLLETISAFLILSRFESERARRAAPGVAS